MRITRATSLHADGGWRAFSFLKLETDAGLTGWAEYTQGLWSPALPAVIDALAARIVGCDPRAYARIAGDLHAQTRFAPGGLNAQAIAAIENACVDIAAKAAGVSVARLFGGPVRDELPLYWSHCGSFRARDGDYFERVLGVARLETLDDMKRLGSEVGARGFRAAKTNPIAFRQAGAVLLDPGFLPRTDPARMIDSGTLADIEAQIEAFRDGLGRGAALMLDANFGCTPDGFARIAAMVAPFDLKWFEVDVHSPSALADLRSRIAPPLASLETIYGRAGYFPYLDARAVDIAIVDVPWNGIVEAMRIAALAEVHHVNVAPHNFYGPLADVMTAHFCAAIPNFEIMEIEVDDVPWKSDLLTVGGFVKDGSFRLPEAPGWGAEVNEEAVAEHRWTKG